MAETKTISERLKDYLDKHNMKPGAFAALSGLPKENIYKWARGTKPSDATQYKKLDDFLNGKMENVPRGTKDKIDKQKNPDEISGLKQELFEAYKREAEMNRKLANANLDDLIKIAEANRALLIRLDKLFPPGLELDKNAFYSVKEGLKDDKNAG